VKKEVSSKKQEKVGNPEISSAKSKIIYDILRRWWYCMPNWPPADFIYTPAL
jgi:hypothetical protein